MATKQVMIGVGTLIMCLLLIGASGSVEQSYALSAPPPSWTPVPDLPQEAGDGVAFILTHTLYYAGGWAGNVATPLDEVYALTLTLQGTAWSASTALTPARFGAAVAVAAERAYLIGGYGGAILNQIDSFDGTTWRSERDLPQPLNFPAAIVTQGRLYVAGGLPGPINAVWSAALAADGTLGNWRPESSLPLGLTTRMAAQEKCLYTVGGKDSSGSWHAEVYKTRLTDDGQIPAWSLASTLPIPLALHAVAIDQSILYVLGGETTGGALNNQVYSIGINPDTCALVGAWASSPLPGGGNRRLAVASRFSELYVLGGQTAAGYTHAVWKGTLPVSAATLTLRKSAQMDGDFTYGQLITYTLSYANPWPHPDGQTGVVITDTIPANTTFVSASSGITPTGGVLHWNIGALPKNASGVVTFTVQVNSPELSWELESFARYDPELTGTMTITTGPVITYHITYTPTAAVVDGILITATLPAQLFPCHIFSATAGTEIAFQRGTGQVVWRVPGIITGPGAVSVSTCVRTPFSTTEILTYTTTLQDVVSQTTHTYSHTIVLGPAEIISPSCTLTDTLYLPWPEEVSPLYPTLVITNSAWVRSSELTVCQPSNVTITRYWPVKLCLPLILRQFNP